MPNMSSPDSASQETSLYDNLPMHGRQIRLIKIISTKPEIVCKLEVVSLDDEPAYSALSYVWGDPETTKSALVNGKRVNVSVNLASALEHATKHLEDAKAAPRLWADAISINQDDPNEKNHQVPFMKDIYSQAEIVICWLGAPDEKIHRAMDWIDVIARECSCTDDDKNLAWLINHPSFDDVSQGGQRGVLDLQYAFLLPYWTRIWIFQEVSLAKMPIFACGIRSVSLASLGQLTCWARLMMDNTTLTKPQIMDPVSWELIKFTFRLIYRALIPRFEARRTEHMSTCLKGRNEAISSESHWRMACSLSTSNPKDYFYGFLSLSCLNLVPDYTPNTSVGMVCRDFLVEYVRASREGLFDTCGELEHLVFAGVGHGWQEYPDTPSWAPNFPGLNKKEGTGWPVFSYSAFYFEDFVISSSEKAKFSGTDMLNTAMILDTVQALGPLRRDFINAESWRGPRSIYPWIVEFAISRENYVTGCHPLAALHSLLHFEAVIQEHGPAPYTPDLKKAMGFAQLVTLYYRDEEYDGDEKSDPEKPSPRMEYLHRLIGGLPIDLAAVDEACSRLLEGTFGKGQRLAETSLGYVGMFPLHVQPGDVVCILNGLRCPAVLRKVDEHYSFVGTCFIQGLETMEQVRQLGRKQGKGVETVVIR